MCFIPIGFLPHNLLPATWGNIVVVGVMVAAVSEKQLQGTSIGKAAA